MQLLAALRGLAHRGGSTLVILAVALVATAAAAAGPIYYAAAKTSILHDTVSGAALIGRGFEAIQTGPVASLMGSMQPTVTSQLAASVGGPANAARLFAPPIEALEVTGQDNQLGKEIDLVWRTNACRQLRIIRGSCPVSNGQVMISQSTVQPTSWHLGQRIRLAGWQPLTVTGIYQVPHLNADYWFNRGATYFPMEEPTAGPATNAAQSGGSAYDALFTPFATMATGSRGLAQGTGVIDDLMRTRNLRPADAAVLQSGITGLTENSVFSSDQITVTSAIPATFRDLPEIHAPLGSWIAAPVAGQSQRSICRIVALPRQCRRIPMPRRKPASPMRLTTNDAMVNGPPGRSSSRVTSRYPDNAITYQKTRISRRFAPRTNASIEK